MSSAANERRSRLREQMKEFYGDPSAGKTNSGTARNTASNVAPEMDLDSEYFSVAKYTTELLRRESLKGLVEADTQLLRSVRRLDHELQELVYQNYAKFISATDTIRDMNSNVSEMDAKLDALTQNVVEVDSLTQKVDSQLREHRGKIEDTITANRRLKKVQFLVGLPATMQQLIDKESYHLCVKYWVAGDGFLSEHTSIASIASIQVRCRDLAKELYARIEKAMCSYPLDDPEAMEIIRRHVEDLRLLRATSLMQSDPQRQQQDAFDEAVLRTLLRGVKENFQNSVAGAKRGIITALAVPVNYDMSEFTTLAEPLTRNDLREVLAQFKGSCAMLLLNTEKVHALLNRLDDASGAQVARRVAEEMQPALMDILAPIGDHLIELASAVLRAVGSQGGALVISGRVDLVKETVDGVVDALCKQLRNVATTMRSLGTLYLEAAKGQQARAYSSLVDRTVCAVLQGCAEDLERMSLQQPHQGAIDRVMAAARARSVFTTLPESVQRQVEQRAFAVARYVLGGEAATLSAGVSHTLANNPDVVSAASVAPALKSLAKAGVALQERFIVLQGQIELCAVLDGGLCNEKSAVDPVVESPAQGGGVPACLLGLLAEWDSLNDWLRPLTTPQPLTNATHHAASAVGGASGGAGGLYSAASATSESSYPYRLGSGGGGTGAASGSRGGASGALASAQHRPYVNFTRRENAALQSTVNRILSQQASVWSTKPADGQPASTMLGVIMYLLKGLTDHVRWRVAHMDTNSFHRLQIGATFLLRALVTPSKGSTVRAWSKSWDDAAPRLLQQQLDELCVSGYERYEAKVPLTNNAIDRVLDETTAAAATLPPQSPMRLAQGSFNDATNESLGGIAATTPLSTTSGTRGQTSGSASVTSASHTTAPLASNPLGGGTTTATSPAPVVPNVTTTTASTTSTAAAVPAPAPPPAPHAPVVKPVVAAPVMAPVSAPAPPPPQQPRSSVFGQPAPAPPPTAKRGEENRRSVDEDEELLL